MRISASTWEALTQEIPAEPPPQSITAIIDTREQTPLCLDPLPWKRGTLVTGDYSVRGLERVIAIERKSLPDLLACIGSDRERFEREMLRMLAYPTRGVVVEATWRELETGGWQSRVTPAAATGSVLGWVAAGVPFVFAGDHAAAGNVVARLLFIAARRRWREARALIAGAIEGVAT